MRKVFNLRNEKNFVMHDIIFHKKIHKIKDIVHFC